MFKSLVRLPFSSYSYSVDYNGNISSMSWKSGNEAVERGYKFMYDGLSRLSVVLLMRNTNQPVKGIITISLRIYTVGFADRSGTSAFNNGFEFKDGIDLSTEYEYDENGNLTKDLNKKKYPFYHSPSPAH